MRRLGGVTSPAMTPDPKRKLKGMLARIFSDAEIEEAERAELDAYLGSGLLTAEETQEVIADFVATTWKIAQADGVISEREKVRLRAIVDALPVERATLPAEWIAVLD